MKSYNHINNLCGWIAFATAAVVYLLTIEPTASFWDCPEFTTSGYKLEVGHPPGAPFFMLTANLFTQFVSDVTLVARMVNTMSALLSAGCILFLFWTITHLVRRLLCEKEPPSVQQTITIMGSGMVGALVYTFSDTFWFSAVESEVYAYSSLFTAVVFWLILKWEDVADSPQSDRWLILIAYLTGLSIGVHLLNLLCIPAIVLVFYYKRVPNATLRGSILALIGSAILVALVLYGIVPGVVKVAGWLEILCVNGLKLPFNTGVILYIVLLVALLIWSVYESYKGRNMRNINLSFVAVVAILGIPFIGYGVGKIMLGIVALALLTLYLFGVFGRKWLVSVRVLHTTLLCLMMVMVGYSSYALIVVRSAANTPMDQNSPEDIFSLADYLGREQYGTRPLLYGQAFSSEPKYKVEDGYYRVDAIEGAPVYQQKAKEDPDEADSYFVVRHRNEYKYQPNMLFPRMHSDRHAAAYEEWLGGIKGYYVTIEQFGEYTSVKMPTWWENIRFFFTYQINYMYMRYFMWNFAGRQNDIQGEGSAVNGNWITGFSAIDSLLYGDQTLLPTALRENKGRNVFYCLPLLLGILGLLWQAYKGDRGIQQFWVVFFLFFMTGLAIVIYLNQTPNEPRERDYAYAGSFYAYAIWVGMGVAALVHYIGQKLRGKWIAPLVTLVCLAVPIQMASQNWDDHDRSGRYTCRDFGQNYLMSLQDEGNPIIYTNGDNDTFPLWYNVETEGVRTDVRVCNLSYLQTDWYIDQMKRPAYSSPAVPISWERYEYESGTNEAVYVRPEAKDHVRELYASMPEESKILFGDDPFELKNILKHWVRSNNEDLHFIPTDTVYVTLDKEAIRRSGMMIPEAYADSLPNRMAIPLTKKVLYKSDLMMLEMIANTNWERPIYIAITVGEEFQMGLAPFFLQEGLAYRITPFNFRELGYAQTLRGGFAIDTEKTYDNLMHKFKFGGIENPNVYIDEVVGRMCVSHRRLFAELATNLIAEGKADKARAALDYCEKVIPNTTIPHDFQSSSLSIAQSFAALGEEQKAADILTVIADNAVEYITWYLSLDNRRLAQCMDDCLYYLYVLDEVNADLAELSSQAELAEQYIDSFEDLYGIYNYRVKGEKE